MSESKKAAPVKHASEAKQARLAAALRENLKRRKTQARAQAPSAPTAKVEEPSDNSLESKEN